MLCMANSWKHQERCIAGLLKNGTWVRPVSTAQGGAITEDQCQLDVGRPIQPLDLVRLPIEKAAPILHQPENQLIANKPWLLLKEKKAENNKVVSLLTRSEHKKDTLFGTEDDKISWSSIERQGLAESLVLVRAVGPYFRRKRTWSGRTQIRSGFTFAGTDYDLPVTFEASHILQEGKNFTQSSSDWWFTVSLGGAFRPYGYQEKYCYMLIAGAIEIPN